MTLFGSSKVFQAETQNITWIRYIYIGIRRGGSVNLVILHNLSQTASIFVFPSFLSLALSIFTLGIPLPINNRNFPDCL